jgi:hypothetical protein
MNKFKTLVIFAFILLIFGANVHANDLGNGVAGYYGPIESVAVNAYGVVWVKLPSGYSYNGSPYLVALPSWAQYGLLLDGLKQDDHQSENNITTNLTAAITNYYSSLLSLLLTAQSTHQNVHIYIESRNLYEIENYFEAFGLPLLPPNYYSSHHYGRFTGCTLGKCDFWPVSNY